MLLILNRTESGWWKVAPVLVLSEFLLVYADPDDGMVGDRKSVEERVSDS